MNIHRNVTQRAGAFALFVFAACIPELHADPAAYQAVQTRIDADLRAGRPLVTHVVVALCDNTHQGIVPVPAALGNGQNPNENLYWGALYGLRGFFRKSPTWQEQEVAVRTAPGILDRRRFHAVVQRGGRNATAELTAEAWDGREMKTALRRFVNLAAGYGKAPHLVVFIGHNGFMEFELPGTLGPAAGAPPRAAMALACASRNGFGKPLRKGAAFPLLLTTGFMAPEAYTLDAAVTAFARGESTAAVHEAAAQAYHRYQRCGINGARRLFETGP